MGALGGEPDFGKKVRWKEWTTNRTNIGQMRPEGIPAGFFGVGASEEVGRAEALELANSTRSI